LGSKRRASRKLLLTVFFLALFFNLEYGGDMFLRKIGFNIGPMVTKYNCNEQVKKYDIGRALSTHGEKRNI
jgi:hypothetical protein